nr:MAG TPA: hypothetical protein [Caudoviricetes sp.]
MIYKTDKPFHTVHYIVQGGNKKHPPPAHIQRKENRRYRSDFHTFLELELMNTLLTLCLNRQTCMFGNDETKEHHRTVVLEQNGFSEPILIKYFYSHNQKSKHFVILLILLFYAFIRTQTKPKIPVLSAISNALSPLLTTESVIFVTELLNIDSFCVIALIGVLSSLKRLIAVGALNEYHSIYCFFISVLTESRYK